MPHIEIRTAQPEDRDAIFAFCTNTWEWGDYIDRVWDEWLADPQGCLLVATADGRPVGITHMRMLNETDAWLEGLRIDPTYRRQGLGGEINEAALVEAMQRGATNVRLVTDSTNTASIKLSESKRLHEVGSFAPYTAQAIETPDKHTYGLETPTLATEADLEDIIQYLDVSNIFPATGGLYYQGFTGYRITDQLLRAQITAEQIFILRRWERLDGLAIAETRGWHTGKQLFIGYIDGTTESISLIAYALRQRATTMGLQQVRAHIPDLVMVRDAFTGADYEWDGTIFLTFERSLV